MVSSHGVARLQTYYKIQLCNSRNFIDNFLVLESNLFDSLSSTTSISNSKAEFFPDFVTFVVRKSAGVKIEAISECLQWKFYELDSAQMSA